MAEQGIQTCCGRVSAVFIRRCPQILMFGCWGQTDCTLIMCIQAWNDHRVFSCSQWSDLYFGLQCGDENQKRLMTNIRASLQEQQNYTESEDQAQSVHAHTILKVQSKWISSGEIYLQAASFLPLRFALVCSAVIKQGYKRSVFLEVNPTPSLKLAGHRRASDFACHCVSEHVLHRSSQKLTGSKIPSDRTSRRHFIS